MGGKKGGFLIKGHLSPGKIIKRFYNRSDLRKVEFSANFAQTQFFDEIFIFSKFILTEFSFVYFADFVISG